MSIDGRNSKGPSSARAAERPVVFISNGCGDHFLALPTLHALLDLFPDRLSLLCDPSAAEIFFYGLPFRRVIEIETWRGERGRRFDAARVARRLGRCDLFMSLNPWHDVAVDELLARSASGTSIGFFPAFEIELQRDYTLHSADLVFSVPAALAPELAIESFADPPRFAAADEAAAARILRKIPADVSLLVVHADSSLAKCWPPERFRELIDSFLEQHPDFLALVVGVCDLGLAESQHAERVALALGLSIPVSCLLLASASLFIGIDSCFLHVADLLRIPAVGLFGPTSPTEWGLRFGRGEIVKEGSSMASIEVSAVLAATQRVLA